MNYFLSCFTNIKDFSFNAVDRNISNLTLDEIIDILKYNGIKIGHGSLERNNEVAV